jgi:exopolyphosphatase / guanosine-5'-triphosphate,3'-diphosphate pyrophosphatase
LLSYELSCFQSNTLDEERLVVTAIKNDNLPFSSPRNNNEGHQRNGGFSHKKPITPQKITPSLTRTFSGSGSLRSGFSSSNVLYGALDLGTNNCRLLIAEPTLRGFRILDAFSRIVRLGEGIGATQSLKKPAIERTIEALKICKKKLDASHVGRLRLVATEACRSALNGEAFIQRVMDEVGLSLEILDRKTEAYLAVTGCASLVDPYAQSVIIFDIGGGSTEIAWLDGEDCDAEGDPCERIKAWDSLPAGVVTLAERYGAGHITPDIFEMMVDTISEMIEDFAAKAAPAMNGKHFHLLGTSGTVTTLGGLHLGRVMDAGQGCDSCD